MLPPLVVTADRVATPRAQVTSSVTVLQGDALRARGIRTVAEALRDVPGMAVVRTGSYGANTAVFMRGGESDYLKVLVDGVVLNDPGGVVNLANLTTEGIERIEVVRGPGSVLYGSDAMTGVVQIFTEGGSRRLRVNAGASIGGYATKQWNAGVAGHGGPLGFSAVGSGSGTNGLYEFNSDYSNTEWAGTVSLARLAQTAAQASLHVVQAEYHYPTDESGNVVDANAYQQTDRLLGSLSVTHEIAPWLDARLAIGFNDGDVRTNDAQDTAGDTLGYFASTSRQRVGRRSADLQLDARLAGATSLSAGLQLEHQRERSTSTAQSEFGPSESALDAGRTNLGVFAHGRAGLVRGLWITSGVRFDENDVFGSFFTFQVGGRYRTPFGVTVRGSVGRGFKEPTFYEQYAANPFARGNPGLSPERTRSWEVALEAGALESGLQASVAYFDQRFRDLIQYTFAPPSPTAPSYYNVAAANARGIEAVVSGRPWPTIQVTLAYTYLRTRVVDAGFDEGAGAGFVEGESLLRRPTHSLNVDASAVLLPQVRVSATGHYVSGRPDRDFSAYPAVPVVLGAHLAADVGVTIDIARLGTRPTITTSLRVENALGATYQEVFGFPAPGRRGLIGVDIGW